MSDKAFFEPKHHTNPFGCHIAMLEIDGETGEPRLLKMVAVDHAGHLINPLIVEGKIHGGLAQGIGQAMIEEIAYGADGQPLTASFMDYALPRASDFPRFELDNTGTPTPSIRSVPRRSGKPGPWKGQGNVPFEDVQDEMAWASTRILPEKHGNPGRQRR